MHVTGSDVRKPVGLKKHGARVHPELAQPDDHRRVACLRLQGERTGCAKMSFASCLGRLGVLPVAFMLLRHGIGVFELCPVSLCLNFDPRCC